MGYVGLPLAVEFGKQFDTLGFDIRAERVEQLRQGIDDTRETTAEELASAPKLRFADDLEALGERSVFIISVPTPVDEHKGPDFTSLIKASQTVDKALKRDDVVVYESTVYPSATEEICVPELERVFGMHFNTNFTDCCCRLETAPFQGICRSKTDPGV